MAIHSLDIQSVTGHALRAVFTTGNFTASVGFIRFLDPGQVDYPFFIESYGYEYLQQDVPSDEPLELLPGIERWTFSPTSVEVLKGWSSHVLELDYDTAGTVSYMSLN